jgi:hypothetical protein
MPINLLHRVNVRMILEKRWIPQTQPQPRDVHRLLTSFREVEISDRHAQYSALTSLDISRYTTGIYTKEQWCIQVIIEFRGSILQT